jgi:hypothetical protein
MTKEQVYLTRKQSIAHCVISNSNIILILQIYLHSFSTHVGVLPKER